MFVYKCSTCIIPRIFLSLLFNNDLAIFLFKDFSTSVWENEIVNEWRLEKDHWKDSPFSFFSHAKQKLSVRGSSYYSRRETRPRPSSTKGESGESAAQLEEPTKFVCSAHSRFPPRFPAFPPFVAAHNDEQCGNAEGFPESGCLLCRRQNMNAILSLRSNPRSSSSPAWTFSVHLPTPPPLFQL